jgi:hypothetical protein
MEAGVNWVRDQCSEVKYLNDDDDDGGLVVRYHQKGFL